MPHSFFEKQLSGEASKGLSNLGKIRARVVKEHTTSRKFSQGINEFCEEGMNCLRSISSACCNAPAGARDAMNQDYDNVYKYIRSTLESFRNRADKHASGQLSARLVQNLKSLEAMHAEFHAAVSLDTDFVDHPSTFMVDDWELEMGNILPQGGFSGYPDLTPSTNFTPVTNLLEDDAGHAPPFMVW